MTAVLERTSACSLNGVPPQSDLTTEVVYVTPELAAKWLSDCPFDYQRTLTPWHVDELAEAMLAGEFEITPIKFYLWGGREHLVDGQHRLSAIVQSGAATPLIVVRQRATSQSQVFKAYGRIDINKKRSTMESIYANRIHEAAGLSVFQTGKVIQALKLLITGFSLPSSCPAECRRHIRNADMLGRGVLQWRDEAKVYFNATEDALSMHKAQLYTAPPLAVALVTFRYQAARAAHFWKAAAERDRLEAQSGEWWITEIVSNRERMYANEMSRRIASAWNAFYIGKPIKHTQIRDVKKAIHILGTPYHRDKAIRNTF